MEGKRTIALGLTMIITKAMVDSWFDSRAPKRRHFWGFESADQSADRHLTVKSKNLAAFWDLLLDEIPMKAHQKSISSDFLITLTD